MAKLGQNEREKTNNFEGGEESTFSQIKDSLQKFIMAAALQPEQKDLQK